MVFAFVFRLLLHRYTQGQRVAFATPVSTRSHPATAAMIGYFLNPLVIATTVDEQQPVGACIEYFCCAPQGPARPRGSCPSTCWRRPCRRIARRIGTRSSR